MSDRSPTLQQLSIELKKVEPNWFVFGIRLGVPTYQLKKIEKEYQKESKRCMIEMLDYWLNNNTSSSTHTIWNDVVLALEEIDNKALATQIRRDHLSTTQGGETSSAFDSVLPFSPVHQSPTPPSVSAVPPPTLTTTSTSTLSSVAEVRASRDVVNDLNDLEVEFGDMIVRVKHLLNEKCDLSDTILFLYSVMGIDELDDCDNFDKLLKQLQRHAIDVFNIIVLQNLARTHSLDNTEMTEVVEAYYKKKEEFLNKRTVLEFQQAVINKVQPILTSRMAMVTIMISKEMGFCRMLKDIEKLAMKGFEECYKEFIHLHAKAGSIIISWAFPKKLSVRLEQLAHKNASVFQVNKVLEVTVGGKKVFAFAQQEDIYSTQEFKVSMHPQLKMPLQPTQKLEQLSILVCGRSGVGKSSLVNSLVGRYVCEVGDPGLEVDSLSACTKLTEQNCIELGNGIQITIYDSPGLQDGTNDEEAYLDDMYSKCKDVDLVLYCIDMTDPRFRREEAHAIDMITRKFGSAIWMRCVLVLTKANLVRINSKYAKTPALYHEILFKNKQSKFLSVLGASIGDKVPVNFPVVAAGHHQSDEDKHWGDRYVYFASEKSKSNDPQSGGNSDGVDFIAELWVTCLETIPESSRVTFLQATASNGRLQQDGKELTGTLKMIMEASNTQTHHPPANNTPDEPGQRGGANKTPDEPGQRGGANKTPDEPGQRDGANKSPGQNGDYKNMIVLFGNQKDRTVKAMSFLWYLVGTVTGAAAGIATYGTAGAKVGALIGEMAGPVGAVVGGIAGAAVVAGIGYMYGISSSDTASSKKEKK